MFVALVTRVVEIYGVQGVLEIGCDYIIVIN